MSDGICSNGRNDKRQLAGNTLNGVLRRQRGYVSRSLDWLVWRSFRFPKVAYFCQESLEQLRPRLNMPVMSHNKNGRLSKFAPQTGAGSQAIFVIPRSPGCLVRFRKN